MRLFSFLKAAAAVVLLASAAQTLVACKTEDVRPRSASGCHTTTTTSTDTTTTGGAN